MDNAELGYTIHPQQPLVGIDELQSGRASVTRLGAKCKHSGISLRHKHMSTGAPSVRVGVAIVDSGCDTLVVVKRFALLHGIPMHRCNQAV